jgi:magnesium chelatase family protein
MEDKQVTISRAATSLTFPANFTLVASMNPCPCGYFGSTSRRCTCNEFQIQRYVSKISGPLMDRIDIHVDVPAVKFNELRGKGVEKSESSAEIASELSALEKFSSRGSPAKVFFQTRRCRQNKFGRIASWMQIASRCSRMPWINRACLHEHTTGY